jgi:hypothetical protein
MRRLTVAMVALAAVGLALAPLGASAQGERVLPRDGSVDGTLSVGSDAGIDHRTAVHRYAFAVEAGETWELFLGSDAFDTYLYLLDASGNVLTSDDDSGGSLDSLIRHEFSQAGQYTVAVSSFDGTSGGSYTLRSSRVVVRPVQYRAIRLGETVVGQFDEAAGRMTSGEVVAGYTLELAEPMRIEVHMDGMPWDASLFVIGPYFESVSADSPYYFGNGISRATLFWPGEYRLLVRSWSPTPGAVWSLRVEPVSEAGPTEARALTPGETVTARLEPGARQAGDRWQFEGRAGQHLIAELESDDFDAYLILRGPSGEVVAENDDSGGTLNSLISVPLRRDGTYELMATRYADGESGAYTLRVRLSTPGAIEARRLSVGTPVTGDLTTADFYDAMWGRPTHLYTLQAEAGQRLRVRLEGEGVTWELIDPTGAPAGSSEPVGYWPGGYMDWEYGYHDDHGGYELPHDEAPSAGGRRELVDLTYGGSYFLHVRGDTGAGAYTLSVTPIRRTEAAAAVLELGTPLQGAVGESSELEPSGALVSTAGFELAESARVVLRAVSPEPPVTLELRRAQDGETVWGWMEPVVLPGESASFASILLPGRYEVIVRQPGGQEATFVLHSERQPVTPPTVTPIAVGQQVEGRLDGAILRAPSVGTPAVSYRLSLEAGQGVRVTMRSAELDAYLVMVNEQGEVVSLDDDSAGGLDAQLVFTSGETAEYRIFAASFGGATSGAFTVQVEPMQ